MTLNRRPSFLVHRPKTAVEDNTPAGGPSRTEMKRTASQTFSPMESSFYDARDAPALGALREGMPAHYPPPAHAHASSFSRASLNLVGSCKHICRRLSASSSRRPSLSAATGDSSASSRKSSSDATPRLLHHDSGMPTPPPSATQTPAPGVPALQSKFSIKQRFGSIRRRPATSGPSGDYARYNPMPVPVPANYLPIAPLAHQPAPVPAPGQAARAAAAAANNERMVQRRQEEQTSAFLAGSALSPDDIDDVIKDSESGVGMACSSPIIRTDSVQEKKLDPMRYLPAEITTMIFAKLDSSSLIQAELVSRTWHQAASSPHVWKSAFLGKFAPQVHVSPTPILMGGAGIGRWAGRGKPVPGQDWKKMYQVRKTIERRWTGCTPSAIYLNGHTDSVYCCQFDEKKIITGSRDRTIRVWDMNTYKCVKVIGGPLNRPQPGTPAPLETHRDMVVSHPSMNGKQEGDSIFQVPKDYHEASILCLQYDDQIMVTGSSDYTCIVWDITGDNYVPITRLRSHCAGVLDVALDEKYIVSCSKDATINVWDRQTYRLLRTLTGHRGPVNAVQLRGHLLVSASGDGIAKLWNLESGACIKEFPSQDRGLAAVEFSDDAKHVLAGGNDHVVYKFDAMTGALLHTSAKHGGLVRSLFLDAHNNRVISGSYDQSIRVADYNTGEIFGLYENWTTSWILSAKSDYRRVVATSQDGRALILDFGWQVDGKELLICDR